jgi:predicted small lipoprotein YifL
MPLQTTRRFILATSVLTLALSGLSACGQKGPLHIPHTPAASQRATLPQTVFGGTSSPSQPASSTAAPMIPEPELPNQADFQ